MSWNPNMGGVHYPSSYSYRSCPYNSADSFMDYFEGLTYEHVNFIFSGDSHAQESTYPSMTTNYYKFGLTEPGNTSHYDLGFCHAYQFNDPVGRTGEETSPFQHSRTIANERTVARDPVCEGSANTSTCENSRESPQRYHNSREYQVILEDNIDPHGMAYETVGTESRGLSQDLLSLLPVSKYKCSFFSRKKSRNERCVICQMEYKREDRQITLPCKHLYHAGCGTKWLSMNKACPICCTEVFCKGSTSK